MSSNNVKTILSTTTKTPSSSINNLIDKKIKSNKPINLTQCDKTYLNTNTNNNRNNNRNNSRNHNQNDDNSDNSDNSDNCEDIQIDDVEFELELEKELFTKSHLLKTHPKNYGHIWTDDERKIILRYLKKNNSSTDFNLYDDLTIQKIAKKIERSEYGVKEEIKKMIFNDYISEYNSLTQLSKKYNTPEYNIKILIRIYLEKYGKKTLYPMEIENKILKCQIENIKLRKELRELKESNESNESNELNDY
jgi:hypothetical protein